MLTVTVLVATSEEVTVRVGLDSVGVKFTVSPVVLLRVPPVADQEETA